MLCIVLVSMPGSHGPHKSARKPQMPTRTQATHLVTSGSHWTVRLGHSRAWVMTTSYKKGVFFFQILYSSLMLFSSAAAPAGAISADGKAGRIHERRTTPRGPAHNPRRPHINTCTRTYPTW